MRLSSALCSLRLAASLALLALAGGLPWLPAASEEDKETSRQGDKEKMQRVSLSGKPEVIATLKGHSEAIYSLAFTPDGKHIVTGSGDHTLKVWDSATGKEVKTFGGPGGHQNLVLSVSLSPDGALIASGGSDNKALLWDFPSSRPLRTIAPSKGAPGSADKPIQVRKLATDTPTKSFPHPNIVDVVSFNPNGTQLATGCHDGRLRLFDVAKGTLLREIQAHVTQPQPSAIYCLAWSADGKQLVTGSYDRSLKLWNAADGKLIREFKGYEDKKFEKGHREGVVFAAFAPDGKTLASAGGWDRSIKIWNVADGSVLRELTNPSFKPGALPQPPQAHPGVVYAVRYTPDGKRLLSAGGAPRLQGYLAIWNAADGTMLYGAEQSLGTLFALAVSADGKYLAVGAGGSSTGGEEGNKNHAYVLKLPAK